jgi:energy-converting hydrogenase Eha subunit A
MALGWTQSVSGRVNPALRRALAREPIAPAWPVQLPIALIVLGWAVMTWPWLSGRYTIPWDAKAHFHPQIQFLARSVHAGEWPWWTPHVFSGHPQVADPQSMLFSPPAILLAALTAEPTLWAVDLMVLLTQLAGGLALMLWVRDQGWHWAGAVLGALVFMFGAAMAWRLQHTGQVLSLAYFPMALVALDRAIRLGSYRWGAVLGLVGAAIVLGRDQVALLVVYVVAAYALWRLGTAPDRRRVTGEALGPLLTGAIVALVIVAIPLFLTAQLAASSNRPSIDYAGAAAGSLHPALLVTWIAPHVFGAAGRMEDYWGPPSFAWRDTGLFIAQNMGQLYVGALPVLLMIVAAWRRQLFEAPVVFFTAAFGITLLYALGWYTPVFRVLYEIVPGVTYYRRPADAVFLIGGLSAILTAYAAHRLFERPWEAIDEHTVAVGGALIGLALFASLGFAIWLDRVGQVGMPLLQAAACVAAAAAVLAYAKARIALDARAMASLLAVATTVDLAVNNGPSTSSALPPAVYEALQPNTANATVRAVKAQLAAVAGERPDPARRDRIEFMGVGFHWPNVSLAHGLENTLGYNPVRLGLYTRATGAGDTIGLPDQRTFSPLFPSYRSTLADLLGLRVIAAGAPLRDRDRLLSDGAFTQVGRTDEAIIYDNPRALPRVLAVTRADGADFESVLATGRWPDDFDPRRTVLLSGIGKTAFVSMVATPGATSARLLKYANTEVVVEASTPRGGWLVLNDPWHPWWFADIGGVPTRILQANVLFRAVELPPGRHIVTFRFRPLTGALNAWRAGPLVPGAAR